MNVLNIDGNSKNIAHRPSVIEKTSPGIQVSIQFNVA